jgi:alpha-L-rhamnosidase
MNRHMKCRAGIPRRLVLIGALLASLLPSPSAFGADAYGLGGVSSDWSNPANWNPVGILPTDPGVGTVVVNPGTYPPVVSNTSGTAGNLIISIGVGMSIVPGGQLTVAGSLTTGNWGGSLPVNITGGALIIGNTLNLGGGGYAGDVRISGGTVTAPALSINTTGGAKLKVWGSGAFITDISQLGKVNNWVNAGAIAGKDPGWTIVVNTNAIAGKIKITVTGADLYTLTLNSKSGVFGPINTNNDLLLGLLPAGFSSGSSMGSSFPGYGVVNDLTDGQTLNWGGAPGGHTPFFPSGTVLTYALPSPSDITNVTTYSVWNDYGRVNQDYTLSVSTDGGASYTPIQVVNAAPGGGLTTPALQVQLSVNGSIKNVTHVRFAFPSVQNNGVGYAELVVQGTPSPVTAPGFAANLPSTLVATRSLPFTLAVTGNGNPAPSYQWYKNGNAITGAIGSSLTFSSFKYSDTGVYYVRLQNSQGSTNSVSCVVTMNPPPSLVPVFVDVASQNASFDPIDTTSDLLRSLIPIGYTNSQPMTGFGYHGVVDDLTDGQTRNDDIDHEAIFPSGTVLTYALAYRSDLTKVATYSSWPDSGRVNQDYTLSVSKDGGATFQVITNVAAVPSVSGSPLQMQVVISPNGPYLATNVTHVRFAFPSVQNNGVGYTELVAQGTPSPVAAPGFAKNLPFTSGAGRQLSFALAVTPTGNPPPVAQWYKDGSPITGANLLTLNFPRFAPGDIGTYFVRLTNSLGSTNSVACVVSMTNQPSVLAFWDAYTRNTSFDPINTANDLILGIVPVGYTNGQPFVTQLGVNALIDKATDGQFGPANPFFPGGPLWFQSNTSSTWVLPSASDITGVATYSGWPDISRVNQDYTLSVSTDGGATFQEITTVSAVPSNPTSPVDLQVLITPNGTYIARYVTHVRFTFGNVQSGGVGYTELMVQGMPSPFAAVSAQVDYSQSAGITVVFSKPLSAATATNLANYTINQGATVSAATLLNATTVMLTTSPLAPNTAYALTINNVQDTSNNLIAANTLVPINVQAASAGNGITITRSGANVVLNWWGDGVLQASTNVLGAYVNMIGPISPWTNALTGNQMFYRFLPDPVMPTNALATAQLRCEYLENPLGLETTNPRLSWIITSDARGQQQTAYQVLVASSESLLNQNVGDLWSSGKVPSDQSALVAYNGAPLTSGRQCFWKVRVWGVEQEASAWSQPALWTMGLLGQEEWEAAGWIGEATRALADTSGGYQWMWYPEGTPNAYAPAGTRYFRRQFSVPVGRTITSAKFNLTCDNGFTLFVNGVQAGQGTNWSQPPLLNVNAYLTSGTNTIAIAATNEGSAAGLTGKLTVQLDDNTSLVVGLDNSWKTANQEIANWKSGSFDDSAWPAAMVLGPMGMAPWGVIQWGGGSSPSWNLPPSPYLRTVFTAVKPIRRATLYATALGTYELHLNGGRVGTGYFSPGWMEFRKRVYYQTYDVTKMLRQGDNALGAILSDGWYSGYIWAGRDTYGTVPKLCVQLRIEYSDGTQQTVATDDTWKLSYGPIREGDVQQGETYDARLEMPGWDSAAFNDSAWQPVTVWAAPNLQIGVSPSPPVQAQQEITPVQMTQPQPGVYVYNLGQNLAGWVRIKATGNAGTKIVLRHSGWLNPDGTIYTNYLREARAIDAYYLKGGGPEIYEPSTTYHGFQYVEVTGYPGTPTLDDVTGIECRSTLPMTGAFACSDARLNKLYNNALWTMRDNLVDVPTGCADRAERLGWCAKTPLVTTWMYALGMGDFSSKWMVDLVDSQSLSANESGAAFLQVAPFWGDVESPGWSDDGISVPYGLYKAYGDTGIIQKHYDAMARYIGYIQSKLVNNLRPANLGIAADTNFVGYGDWLAITQNREGNADIFNTLLNGASVKMMAEMANAIGRTADAAAYRTLFANMQAAFNSAYVSSQGVVRDDSQMEYALALYHGFIPTNKISMSVSNLANDILNKSHQQTFPDALGNYPTIPPGHLTTGFHGSRALLPVLSQYGRNDVAYGLLLTDTYPSWLYPITLGATTTWERWDGWTPDKGFQNPGMNSFSMPDLMASLGEWLFNYVGGIGQQGTGFKNSVIKPYIGAGLTWAQAAYDSIHGTIAVRWEKSGGALVVNVTIPANTSATVSLPGSGTGPFTIQEGGTTVWSGGACINRVPGISGASVNAGRVEVQVASGSYRFRVTGGE